MNNRLSYSSIETRFWSKVNKTDNCWNWTAGNTGKSGYGRFRINNKKYLAHRISWEIHNGSIPKGTGYHGVCVLHKCDNRKCVNPKHLYLGNHKQNMKDKIDRNRANFSKDENRYNHILTNKDIPKIKNLYKFSNYSQRGLAKIFKVSQTTIRRVLNKKSWKHIK